MFPTSSCSFGVISSEIIFGPFWGPITGFGDHHSIVMAGTRVVSKLVFLGRYSVLRHFVAQNRSFRVLASFRYYCIIIVPWYPNSSSFH